MALTPLINGDHSSHNEVSLTIFTADGQVHFSQECCICMLDDIDLSNAPFGYVATVLDVPQQKQ